LFVPVVHGSTSFGGDAMNKRVTLSPEAIELLADLLSDEWLLRQQLVDSDSAAMEEWHRGLAALAADTFHRITGRELEGDADQRTTREFEQALERTFGVKS
jgi:hypothetical protein